MIKFLKLLFSKEKHECPNCKKELTCIGSVPWGLWTYKCDDCKYEEPKYPER